MSRSSLRSRRRRVPSWPLAAAAAALLTAGCYTGVDDSVTADTDGAGSDGSGGGDDDDDDDDDGPDALCEEGGQPGLLPRLVRLTHSQYDNSVEDLLQVGGSSSNAFIGDPAVAGFQNNAEALVVTDRLARDYRRAAEQNAEAFVADTQALEAVLGCDPADGDAGCVEDFIVQVGRRAYRRPLTEDEVAKYLGLYETGDGLYDSGSSFEQGLRLVVEGLLQSPHFLYRVELSSDVQENDPEIIKLTSFEVATRLAYFLWDSAPDDALIDAAEAGELDSRSGVEAQARRMLDDERAVGPIHGFHEQWLDLDDVDDLTKDPEQFPEFHPGMTEAFREETQRFIERVALEMDGTYADLLTSNVTFVNADLARVYGLDGDFPVDELVEVELPADERSGLLTQAGFLASHAFADITSPIHRGVFIQRKVLCAAIPDPPGDVDTNLPPLDGDLQTTRDRVEAHTAPAACSGCHDMINAPGYALEGYDALGRVRSEDNGVAVDTETTVLVGAEEVDIADGIDLAQTIADSEAGQRCYTLNWFRYANMRQETADDTCTINGIHELMLETDYDIKELLVAMTLTTTFRYRSAQEVD